MIYTVKLYITFTRVIVYIGNNNDTEGTLPQEYNLSFRPEEIILLLPDLKTASDKKAKKNIGVGLKIS